MKLNLALALLVATTLVGCAFGKDDNSETSQEVLNKQKLMKSYEPILGKYQGSLVQGTTSQVLELEIYTLESEDGSNSDGSRRTKIDLMAYYKKVDPVGPGFVLRARYAPETGDLTLTNPNPQLSLNDVHTITAKSKNGEISGKALSQAGPLGTVTFKLSATPTDGSTGTNPRDDYYERVRKAYAEITGTYKGIVLPPAQDAAPFKVTIKLYVVDVTQNNGDLVPTLMGTYSREDDPYQSLDMTLAITYQPDTEPKQISMVGKVRNSTSDYRATLNGRFINGDIVGDMQSTARGYEGKMQFKKVK